MKPLFKSPEEFMKFLWKKGIIVSADVLEYLKENWVLLNNRLDSIIKRMSKVLDKLDINMIDIDTGGSDFVFKFEKK